MLVIPLSLMLLLRILVTGSLQTFLEFYSSKVRQNTHTYTHTLLFHIRKRFSDAEHVFFSVVALGGLCSQLTEQWNSLLWSAAF